MYCWWNDEVRLAGSPVKRVARMGHEGMAGTGGSWRKRSELILGFKRTKSTLCWYSSVWFLILFFTYWPIQTFSGDLTIIKIFLLSFNLEHTAQGWLCKKQLEGKLVLQSKAIVLGVSGGHCFSVHTVLTPGAGTPVLFLCTCESFVPGTSYMVF